MSWSENFGGVTDVTCRCAECGGDVTLGASNPERLRRDIADGLVVPLCGPCSIARQAKNFLDEGTPDG